MNFLLATIAINEMEWLPSLYEQHKDWPGLVKWCFVEGADAVYAKANPELVSPEGLSTDGTTEFLADLARRDPRVIHIRHGIARHDSPDQGKCELRNVYWERAEQVKPDIVMVVDSDEFYTHDDQLRIDRILGKCSVRYQGWCFRQRHIWRPASIAHYPLFHAEVTGGYWNMHHYRAWRWRAGRKHRDNHNIPEGIALHDTHRYDGDPSNPQCQHLGFASSSAARVAKHKYYEERGEGKKDGREMYVACRLAWETWRPGDALPFDARVIPYWSDIPEIFQPVKEEPRCDSGHAG
jgi:glycosyltransferase involved in cell wall biosynthesis